MIKRLPSPIEEKMHIFCFLNCHQWSNWQYEVSNLCKQVRKCKRCGKVKDMRINHDWTPWEYKSDNVCFQERTCRRDGGKETRINHVIEAKEDGDRPCITIWKCTRCGFVEGEETNHVIEAKEDEDSPCTTIWKCTRCGFVERLETNHHWGSPEFVMTFGSDTISKETCSRCGEEQLR
jgi:hypothetical protein